jgi:threonine dehydratase
VLVSDTEIRHAMALILARAKLLVEPAGAAAVAALLAGKIPLSKGPVVAVLSGGNVDMDRLPDLLAGTAGPV